MELHLDVMTQQKSFVEMYPWVIVKCRLEFTVTVPYPSRWWLYNFVRVID